MKRTTLSILAITLTMSLMLAGCKGKDETSPSDSGTTSSQSKPAETNPEAVKAAVACAENWLVIVDQSDYTKSWEQSAALFKQVVPVDQWQNQMKVFRSRLGKVISRKQKSAQYTTTAPGVPDGQYVIIQYDTSFENKATAVETVIPMLDEDKTWRVSGYTIK